MKHEKKAFTLIELSMLLILIGVILVAYSKILPHIVKESQVNKTKQIIDSKKDSIISFSQNSKTLPTSITVESLGSQNSDVWDNDIGYIHDSDLELNKNICNKNTTNLSIHWCTSVSPCNPYKVEDNIAFIVYSGGYNQNIQSTLDSNIVKIYPPDIELNDMEYDDIVESMSLVELRSRTYCNREKLKILNTYIRKIKASSFYDFKIYPEGGVPYDGGNYVWSYTLESTDPFVDSCTDNLDIESKASVLEIDCGIKPKNNNEYQFTFTVSDNEENSYTRINFQTTDEVLPTMYITAQVDIYYNKGSGCTQLLNGNSIEFYDGESITFYQEDNCIGKSISNAYNQISSIDANEDNIVFVTKGSTKPDIYDN